MFEEALDYLTEIRYDYPELRLIDIKNGVAIYEGCITLNNKYKNKAIVDDQFKVEIEFPINLSDRIPSAKETGKRIPREIDYHVYKDGEMCLGSKLEILRRFSEDPSLKGFIINLLEPFLFSYSWKEKYGEYPFGELPHGHKGIYQFYKDEFKTDNGLVILNLLKIPVENNYRGHMICPCGSKARLRDCHGNQLREINEIMKREDLLIDLYNCIKSYIEEGNKLPNDFISKRLRTFWNKVKSKYR